MNKLIKSMEVLRQGCELANAATWKNRTVAVNALVVFIAALLGLAAAFGYEIPLSGEQIEGLAVAVFTIVTGGVAAANVVLTVATSSKVGLAADKEKKPLVE